jgi:tetratricopeptide (TPR) repeat protein
MRYAAACALLLALCFPAVAADEKLIDDCDYWRLGKDENEKKERLQGCDRIIDDKRFSKADRAMAYAERASFASSNNRNEEAISDLDHSLALEPDNLERRRDRAFLLYFAGKHDRAIDDFDQILAAKADGHITAFRGLAHLEKGDEARGFADLGKSIEIDPQKFMHRYWRAREYAKRGKIDAAIADTDAALALSPDRDTYLLRAELHTRKGDTGKAIADLTSAAELDPDYTVPYFNRALLYEEGKQYDLALADYDTILRLSPGDAYYTGRRAELLNKMGASPAPASEASQPKKIPAAPQAAEEGADLKKSAEPPPAAETKKVAKRASAGSGECRRFDAIANMTISVACPD